MKKARGSKQAGRFIVSNGREIYGELTLAGDKTSLYLQDEDEFSTRDVPGRRITGVLRDLTKVSLIDCVTMSGKGSVTRGAEGYQFATVFPHFVVSGETYLDPEQTNIVQVRFIVDDASTLFYDFDAFSLALDANPFIEGIVNANANAVSREIDTGPDPKILYFTGKKEIFAADTILGRVRASHNPSHNLGGPNGVWLKNTIVLAITFSAPVIFSEAISRMSTLLRYLELLVGRPQNIVSLNLETHSSQHPPAFLEVHWSLRPKRSPSRGGGKPHPADVLLDAIRRTENFSLVLKNWLDRDQDWRVARARFFNGFGKQNHYTIDRLIGAANMFDILPFSAVPLDNLLSDNIEHARKISRDAFSVLPKTPERDSVLSALGRIGKPALKRKIRHRTRLITDIVSGYFPDLDLVTDEAVSCRNYSVHGNDAHFDYNANLDCVNFFTDTLEFVFAASDLIQAGWDVANWCSTPTSMSHPFTRFLINYREHLRELKAILPTGDSA